MVRGTCTTLRDFAQTLDTDSMRLDHVIVETGDILRTTRHLREALQFPEAWPIGPFWPRALTCGLCIGDFNLELVEPLDRDPELGLVQLVFAPCSLEEATQVAPGHRVFEKIESDPALLRMRGFERDRVTSPQPICLNVIPEPAQRFFFCSYYEPLLTALAPGARPPNPVTGIEIPAEWLLPTSLLLPPITIGARARLILASGEALDFPA